MKRYEVSFTTTVDIVNAEDFTDDEIETALTDDLRREVSDNGGWGDHRTEVIEISTIGKADYGLRLVRMPSGFIDTQHPDDPA